MAELPQVVRGFGVTFATSGSLLEDFGCIFGVEKQAGRQRCHKRRQSDIAPK